MEHNKHNIAKILCTKYNNIGNIVTCKVLASSCEFFIVVNNQAVFKFGGVNTVHSMSLWHVTNSDLYSKDLEIVSTAASLIVSYWRDSDASSKQVLQMVERLKERTRDSILSDINFLH